MKHSKLALIALSTALLLSGCNMDKAATTTADATAVTEEVTKTATAEVTTVAASITSTVTTTAVTTTAEPEPVESTSANSEDKIVWSPDSKDFSTLSEQIDILEKHFYGKWQADDPENISWWAENNVKLTYSEDMYEHGLSSIYGISETDTGYFLKDLGGGIVSAYYIGKDAPDIMYYIMDGGTGSDEWLTEQCLKNGKVYYRTSGEAEPFLGLGRISVLGQIKLNAMYGVQFDSLSWETTITDEDGIVWGYDSGDLEFPYERRYLIDYGDDFVKLAFRFREIEHRFETRYYTFTFKRNDSGEWSVTDYEPFNAPEDVKYFNVPMMFTNDKNNDMDAAGMWLYLYVYADGHTYREYSTGGVSIHAEHFAGWVFTDDDKEAAEIDAAFAPYCDENGLNVKLISSMREVQTYHLLENTPFEENYWKHTLRGDGYMHWKTYVVDDEWLVYLDNDNSVGITFVGLARRDDIYSNIRWALDVLWEYNDKYPDMRVIFRTDMAEDKSYLDIAANADELPEIEKLLTKSDVDMSECRLMTADEVRAEWLPVKCYAHYDGKYTESDLPANTMKAFTYSRGDDVYRLENFTGVEGADGVLNYVESNCTAEELEKLTDALTEHGIKPDAFETATTYADVFDIVQLPHDRDMEEGTFYRINDTVIIEELPPIQGKYRYNIWEYDDTHTEFRKAVKQFRIKPLVDNDFNKYYINSIEYIAEGYDPNNSPVPDGYELRVVADKQYWDGIMKYAEHEDMNYGAKKDSFVLTEKTVK